jgi:aryl carrier-like protein
VGGVILGLLAVVAVASVVLWRTLVGEAFASAQAVPTDAQLVVTVDLLQVRDPGRIEQLYQAFAEPLAAAGLSDEDPSLDLIEAIDESWQDELGVTFSDDVLPWLGRSMSVAVWPGTGSLVSTDEVEVLISVRTRDAAATRALMERVLPAAAEDEGATFERSIGADGRESWSLTYEGDRQDSLHATVAGDLLLMANSRAALDRSLAALDGTSIRDTDDYSAAVERLPADRLVAVYLAPDLLADVWRVPELGMDSEMLTEMSGLDDLRAMAGAATLRDDGVAFDLVQLYEEGAEVPGFADPDLRFPSRLPADTFGFYAVPIPDGFVVDYLDLIDEIEPGVMDEARRGSVDVLGIDVFGEVLPAFGRELVLAAVPASDGVLARGLDREVGLVGAIGVTESAPVADAVARGEQWARDQGAAIEIVDGFGRVAEGDDTLFAYGLTTDGLVVGSSLSTVRALAAGSGGLAAAPLYAELDAALAGDGLLAYVDLHRIYDLIDWDPEYRAIADPLRGAGASMSVDADSITVSSLLLIDY